MKKTVANHEKVLLVLLIVVWAAQIKEFQKRESIALLYNKV